MIGNLFKVALLIGFVFVLWKARILQFIYSNFMKAEKKITTEINNIQKEKKAKKRTIKSLRRQKRLNNEI